MKDIAKKSVFVQILPDDALQLKRELLEIELYLLQILKTFLSIKDIRKVQLKIKKDIRTQMNDMTMNINKIVSSLPVEQLKVKQLFKEKEESTKGLLSNAQTREKGRIDAELRKIKEKLERLD